MLELGNLLQYSGLQPFLIVYTSGGALNLSILTTGLCFWLLFAGQLKRLLQTSRKPFISSWESSSGSSDAPETKCPRS